MKRLRNRFGALPDGEVALPPAEWPRSGIYLGMAAEARWMTDGMPARPRDWHLNAVLGGQRVVNGVPVTEATGIMIGGPGAGKTLGWLLGMVGLQDWRGPVLCLSTRTDLARYAGPRRERLGKVQVVDWRGDQVASLPYPRVRWNLLDGCEAPAVVLDRMKVMYETVELGRPASEAIWSAGAVGALTAWAHAAVLEGGGLPQLLRWQRRGELVEPQKILKRHRSAAGFGEDLAALADSAAEQTTDSKLQSTHAVLAALADPAILDGCSPDLLNPGLDIDGFLNSSATLFVCDKGGKSATSPQAPLTVALVNAILEKAEALAVATAAGPGRLPGRLARPLLVVIDEVSNISPLPNLVQVFSQARGHGYAVAVAAQSWSQLTERWGEAGASAIWDTAAYRLVGAGLRDMDFLTSVSKSLGEREVWRPSVGSQSGGAGSGAARKGKSESHTLVETPNYKASALAALPEAKAILMGREGARPVQLPALPSLLEALALAEERDLLEALNAPSVRPSWRSRLQSAVTDGPPDTAYGPDYQPDTWGWPPPKPPWWSRLRRNGSRREETP